MRIPILTWIVARFKNSLANRGVGGTLLALVPAIRSYLFTTLPYWFAEWRFDRKWGVDTAGRLAPSGSTDVVRFAERYQATPPGALDKIIRRLGIDPSQFVFIDIGCGKARVMLEAARHPFKSVTGIEFSADLAEIAARNLRNNRFAGAGLADARVVQMDAREYEFPDENLIIFMYNPFKEPVMTKVLANIVSSNQTAKSRYIIYYNPVLAGLLDSSPHFSVLDRRREYSIYIADAAMTHCA